MIRQTHTFATLEVSSSAYQEVATKLRAAGYDHAFGPGGEIDMHGIALVAPAPTADVFSRPECPFNYCDQKDGGACKENGRCHHRSPGA